MFYEKCTEENGRHFTVNDFKLHVICSAIPVKDKTSHKCPDLLYTIYLSLHQLGIMTTYLQTRFLVLLCFLTR